MATKTTTPSSGTLTIAGSGIASIAHITLETLSCIKEADKVYYAVTDPATEAFIQENTKGEHFDLSVYYDTNKHRYTSYVQMCEVMLRAVRAGNNVLGVFYGHPGVFVSPSHRALAIAREEGYKAQMLPGVSAEDYLFADLGVDPAVGGCVTYEATEFLLKNKSLDPSTHNVLWQVGAVGVRTMVFDNAKFSVLVDRLEQDFGPDHKVVHYMGAVLPQSATTMDVFTIAELRKEEVTKQINTCSTFYIPPRDTAAIEESMAQKLNIPLDKSRLMHPYPPPKWSRPGFAAAVPAYGPEEKNAIAQIDNHVAPDDYQILHASPAMKKFMIDLATNRGLLEAYKANPSASVESREGLTTAEKAALSMGTSNPIHKVMRATQSDIDNGKEVSIEELEENPNVKMILVVVPIIVII